MLSTTARTVVTFHRNCSASPTNIRHACKNLQGTNTVNIVVQSVDFDHSLDKTPAAQILICFADRLSMRIFLHEIKMAMY
jgi:hypothetical protein